jgi:small conductance mechanosensitive channel
MENYLETIKTWLLSYGPNVLAALIIFVAGWIVAKVARSMVRRLLQRAQMDETLSVFLSRLVYMLFLAFVVVAAIQKLGVDTTSFAAIIAAAGLAIGFALQGSLSNFAAGVMIIALRPFKVGDFIEAGGVAGAVEAVSVFATELKTPDNKKIILPNSAITSGNITNYSAEEIRRIDLVVGIGYEDDIRKAKSVLEAILSEDKRVLEDPASTVAVAELGDSSVNLVVRPWVKSENYWPAKFDLTERIKLRLDEEDINIPFPQRDLHIYNVGEKKTA